jgi:hypothetical protein
MRPEVHKVLMFECISLTKSVYLSEKGVYMVYGLNQDDSIYLQSMIWMAIDLSEKGVDMFFLPL